MSVYINKLYTAYHPYLCHVMLLMILVLHLIQTQFIHTNTLFVVIECYVGGTNCGLVIHIDDKYKADVIININSYEHWEGLIIKVNGGNLSKKPINYRR